MRKSILGGSKLLVVVSSGLCVCLAVLVVGLFALTRPVVDASEQFLALLSQGKVKDAYGSTANALRAVHDEPSFAMAVKQLGLTDYSSASWHNRQIENQYGTAEGTVTTKNGLTRPIYMGLIRESGRWAVMSIRYGGVDLTTINVQRSLPAQAAIEQMVADALLSLNNAVQIRDFTAFYENLSDGWKKQTSPQKLQKTFQVFLDKKIDIEAIKNMKPLFGSPAALKDNGLMVIAGHYPTRPSQVGFELEYASDRNGWKLMGITVNVGKSSNKDE